MRFRRPSPAMIVALCALVVALSGTSYAALKLPKSSVGPKQLKKNAVSSSKKVKRGALLLSDFKKSQRSRLRGPQGVPGLVGETGARGATGPVGPSNAYTAAPASQVANEDVTLSNLPPGSYVIMAKAYAYTLGDGIYQVNCDLTAGGVEDSISTTIAKQAATENFVQESLSQHLTRVLTSGGSATFRCNESTGSVGIYGPRITAIRVGSVASQ